MPSQTMPHSDSAMDIGTIYAPRTQIGTPFAPPTREYRATPIGPPPAGIAARTHSGRGGSAHDQVTQAATLSVRIREVGI